MENCDNVQEISIIPRGHAGGYTLTLDEADRSHMTKQKLLDTIVMMLGGRSAEEIMLNDITTGASNDIQRASRIARDMVTKYGMSDEIGPIAFGTGHDEVFLGRDYSNVRNYSETVAAKIDNVVGNIISDAYKRCESLLREHYDQLERVAEHLVKHEKINEADFIALMENKLSDASADTSNVELEVVSEDASEE